MKSAAKGVPFSSRLEKKLKSFLFSALEHTGELTTLPYNPSLKADPLPILHLIEVFGGRVSASHFVGQFVVGFSAATETYPVLAVIPRHYYMT